jgi:hypothetical protein
MGDTGYPLTPDIPPTLQFVNLEDWLTPCWRKSIKEKFFILRLILPGGRGWAALFFQP